MLLLADVSRGLAVRRRLWPDAFVVLIYSGLSAIPYWDFWMAGGTRIAGKGGDVADETWFLAWVPYALLHAHNPLITDWGNYPSGVNGVANTSAPLLGVLGTPVTSAFGAFATAALFFTLAFPLSALAAYLLLRHWIRWRPAAFAGGLLYGFSPYVVAQGLGHLNLVFVPLPPLIFLVLSHIAAPGPVDVPRPADVPQAADVARPADVPRPRKFLSWGALLALLCVAQFFISIEVLASTAIIGVTGLLAAAAVRPDAIRDRWRPVASAVGIAAVSTAVLLAYPVWLLVAGPERTAGPVQETYLYRGNLLAPVIPDSSMFFRVARFAPLADTFSGNTSENGLYLGIPLLVVLVVGAIVLRRRSVMKIAVIMVAAAFVLTLGARLTVGRWTWRSVPLPGALLTRIPLLDNAIAARFSLYVMLGAALMLAITLEAMHDRLGRATRRSAPGAACGVLACLALVPLVPAWPYAARLTQVPAYFSSDAVRAIPSGGVAVTYPFATSADATPMLWQIAARLRFKSPGGRFIVPASAPGPVEQALTQLAAGHEPAPAAGLRCELLAELRSWRVLAVLVQPTGRRPSLVMPFFEWLLGRPPDTRSGGISAWYGQVASPRCS